MKRTLLASTLCLLVCMTAWGRGEERPGAPGVAPVSSADPAEVDSADPEALGTIPVEVSKAGPWTIRRTARGRAVGREGAMRRAGAPATTGAPAPAPPCEPAPGGGAFDGAPMLDDALSADAEESGMGPPPPPTAAPTTTRARGGRSRRPTAQPGELHPPLRAGSTDDNEAFDAFLAFVDEQFASGRVGTWSQKLDVRGRRALKVIDQTGDPVPAAKITVLDEAADRAVWRATTYGDGTAPFYPAVAGVSPGAPLLVEVRIGDTRARARWDGAGDCVVRLDAKRPERSMALDVCFVIDTTGSMGDEIARIQQSLLAVTRRLRDLGQEFDLRYGAVLYKDLGDEYLTSAHPFTSDIAAFDRALSTIGAGGGGDGPESLNQALAVAVNELTWREGAARVAFVITDAPPHMDYAGDVPYGKSLVAAVGRGIRLHSVGASGLDADGTVVLRQAAQFTRGKFVFIEYGGDVNASAAAHGVRGPVKGNNLDDILFDQLRDEVARWGR